MWQAGKVVRPISLKNSKGGFFVNLKTHVVATFGIQAEMARFPFIYPARSLKPGSLPK
jgi:hypothetical protein